MCTRPLLLTALHITASKQDIITGCIVPADAVPKVRSVLWHSDSAVQTTHSPPVQSCSAWAMINADEPSITNHSAASTIHDTIFFLLSDMSAHLTLLTVITYHKYLDISVSPHRAVILQFVYHLTTDFFIYLLYFAAYSAPHDHPAFFVI